jgi:hypothetical protein
MNARFQHCLNLAEAIVQSYRDEAPEGCDPQNSMAVIGIAGTAVAVGGSLYAANQSKKAGEKAANVEYNTESVMLDDPAQMDPMQVLQQLYSANKANFGQAREQASTANKFNYNQALKFYNKILPGFSQLQGQMGQNALSMSRGELPGDVQSSITRAAAQQGIQGGFGFGSQGASGGALGNLNLRNLGLTSFDAMKYGNQLGMSLSQNAKSLLPNMMGLQDFMLTPQQSLGISQFNTGSQNQFALQNNQLANQSITAQNQALANQTQQQYANELQQAQMIGQTSQQVGGLMSSAGAMYGGGGGGLGGMNGATYMGTGNSFGLPTNQSVYRPKLA